MFQNQALEAWVSSIASLTRPAEIHLCTGTDDERSMLVNRMLADGTLEGLDPATHPGCYLHRSHPDDVARVEHLTFVCTEDREDAGPNNHWMDPDDARRKMRSLFDGAMEGRTMYVIPYVMGQLDSPYARAGVEITDSAYVVANMALMARIGTPALERIGARGGFVKGLHSTGDLDPERRFIMHFPETLEIMSFGSGYGGNALLGKKCHALRIASWQARQEGWLAEHMLIVGIESPEGQRRYIAAAFPSACGKTNMAMLVPPEAFAGWKVWTVGDDIAWLNRGADGRLYAINPEAGFFGVAPGTSAATNPVCLATLGRDTIYTNVAVTDDRRPWWEGLDGDRPQGLTDWQGRPHDPANGPAAHPNARFTVSMKQCPTYAPEAEEPVGVPISAIVFGGRRAQLAPLVFEARDWGHGVFVGSAVASETTAAAAGAVGEVRRDPMAMKPFCGYNFADYWAHWLSFAEAPNADRLPKVFHVNWFRKAEDGAFLWPGFGENMRVLKWILDRCEGRGDVRETPIGGVPTADGIPLDGLSLGPTALEALLAVDERAWLEEVEDLTGFYCSFGGRVPDALQSELEGLRRRLRRDEAA